MLNNLQGVNQIIVAVNKLENTFPAWNQERYCLVESRVRNMLIELKFRSKAIRVIPVSGLLGENIMNVSQSCLLKTWYNGITLLEGLDSFNIPIRSYDKPFRGLISRISASKAHSHDVCIKVLQGHILCNRTINISFNGFSWVVKQILSSDDQLLDSLKAGEQGILRISKKYV